MACRSDETNLLSRVLKWTRAVTEKVHHSKPRFARARQGSSNDIGWLRGSTGSRPTVDRTQEFQQRIEQIGRGVRTNVVREQRHYILVPGLFSKLATLYFGEVKEYFEEHLGWSCEVAIIDSEASVESNAQTIKDLVLRRNLETGLRIVLLGHSKGGLDATAACALYWGELQHIVVGVILGQSPYAGNPIASDFLREGQIADNKTRRVFRYLMQSVFMVDNLECLEDLTYENRRRFLDANPLPDDLSVVSFHTDASFDTESITTMSRISYVADVIKTQYLCALHLVQYASKRITVPLPVMLATCADYLRLRYDEASDGLVTRRDAEVPGSIVIRPEWKKDHGWMVLPSTNADPNGLCPGHVWEALCMFL